MTRQWAALPFGLSTKNSEVDHMSGARMRRKSSTNSRALTVRIVGDFLWRSRIALPISWRDYVFATPILQRLNLEPKRRIHLGIRDRRRGLQRPRNGYTQLDGWAFGSNSGYLYDCRSSACCFTGRVERASSAKASSHRRHEDDGKEACEVLTRCIGIRKGSSAVPRWYHRDISLISCGQDVLSAVSKPGYIGPAPEYAERSRFNRPPILGLRT
ncbi:hypothetical protein FKP32DRAFT_355288 [Trametes sanguinea]|nr:hypothetical protein FKP32DRAFT_355288 [Trametes sanguinea]